MCLGFDLAEGVASDAGNAARLGSDERRRGTKVE